jgi:O-succinylbenzoic acid--CoA ligase
VDAALPCPASLRTVIVGGGQLSSALAVRALDLGWRVVKTFGMTEAASMVAAQGPDDDPADGGMLVLPHWQASADEQQTLTLKGPALAKGYATRSAEGAWSWTAIDPEAGFRTRDRVELSGEAGRLRLRFLGRESSFVKILGELVSLVALQERIEAAARRCGFSRRVVIATVPDARSESGLVLVIEGSGASAAARESLLASYNAAALPFERIEIVREVESLPLVSLGKVDAIRLGELLR